MPNVTFQFASIRELWQFVLSFEEGSLPREAWNDRTVAAVAVWYLSMLPIDEAVSQLAAAIQRNQRRFREGFATVRDGVVDLTPVWPRILQLVLTVASARDPLPLANRLLRDPGTVLANRVA